MVFGEKIGKITGKTKLIKNKKNESCEKGN